MLPAPLEAAMERTRPTPHIPEEGRLFEFDFPGVLIGSAEYPGAPTGCTAFLFPKGILAAADIRGGSPGTVLADDIGLLNGLCFAGGSLLGLEAASGVASELFGRRGHEHVEWSDVPVVAGAIMFDFNRDNGIYPDRELGAAAARAAREGRFLRGPHGAGRNVSVGKGLAGTGSEPGGQGAAMRQVGETTVLAFTVVNALGAIVDRAGNVVRGHLDAATGNRLHLHQQVASGLTAAAPNGNTTLTLILTNQRLSSRDLRQFGRQVHASMARAIQPFHTQFDGDVLFAASTNAVTSPALADLSALGAVASEAAWDAVLNCFD
jgi:L-aminopeptidase/D-esterase-like protein